MDLTEIYNDSMEKGLDFNTFFTRCQIALSTQGEVCKHSSNEYQTLQESTSSEDEEGIKRQVWV